LTREVATVSNGSIARSRIINANRSDKAQLMIYMKFGVDVPLSKVVLFKSAVKKFVLDRPQEFCNTVGFRMTRVETDLGFAEYVITVQSRDSWQKVITVLESKAKVSAFCLEVQKKLEMKYVSPPMPVNLKFDNPEDTAAESQRRESGGGVKRKSNVVAQGTPSRTTIGAETETAKAAGKHHPLPSMGEHISAIAALFGGDDRKKSR